MRFFYPLLLVLLFSPAFVFAQQLPPDFAFNVGNTSFSFKGKVGTHSNPGFGTATSNEDFLGHYNFNIDGFFTKVIPLGKGENKFRIVLLVLGKRDGSEQSTSLFCGPSEGDSDVYVCNTLDNLFEDQKNN